MDLATLAAQLYGLPPKEFTAARDARASEARAAGDKDLAASLKQLRKPSVGAWMANMLVRRQPREIEQLIELGETLRAARNLDGAQIRSATKQKQEIVTKLARQARSIATRLSQPVSQAAEIELEATLDTAFADLESAQSLRAGDLTTSLHYSGLGFGPATKADERADSAVPLAAAALPRVPRNCPRRSVTWSRPGATPGAETDVENAQQAVTAAEADLKRLRAALTVAVRQATKANEHAAEAVKRLEHLSRGRTRRSAPRRVQPSLIDAGRCRLRRPRYWHRRRARTARTSTASSALHSSGPSPVRSQRSQWRPESRKLLAQSSSSA